MDKQPLTLSSNRFVRRLAEHWRRYGAIAVVDLLLDRFLYRVIGIDVVEVLWLEVAKLRPTPPKGSRYTFRALSPDEVRKFAADPSNDFAEGSAERAAAEDDVCFAALDGERLAAYGWYALASPETKHVYPADVVYMTGGFTHPDYRGERLHATTKILALQYLANRGIRKLLSLVHWTNMASRRSSARLGCLSLGRMWMISLGSRTVMLTPRRARRLGVQFRSAKPPRPTRSVINPSVLDDQLAHARSLQRSS